MAEEVFGRARHRVSIAHIGAVDAHRARVGQRRHEFAQRLFAPGYQTEDGALRRVFTRQRLAESAGGAGEEDFEGTHRRGAGGKLRIP
ncbi:hypothetical protein D9M71_745660 [compost metagenome]